MNFGRTIPNALIMLHKQRKPQPHVFFFTPRSVSNHHQNNKQLPFKATVSDSLRLFLPVMCNTNRVGVRESSGVSALAIFGVFVGPAAVFFCPRQPYTGDDG